MQQITTSTQRLTDSSLLGREGGGNAPKYQYFNGMHFTRDDHTGYYLNSTQRIRMHRYVWEFYNGEIPSGHDIHHKDHNKANNKIENLESIPSKKHSSMHCSEMVNGDPERTRKHLDSIRPKASVWHKGKDGAAWHKAHYEQCKENFHASHNFICENCGESFSSTQVNSRFCSNACKSAWRRKSGTDKVERICVICGGRFTTNRYSKASTCCIACRGELKKRRGK